MKQFFEKLLAAVVLTFLLYILILMYPQPFFRYQAQVGNILLYMDEPANESVYRILEKAKGKLDASGLNDPSIENRIFLTGNTFKFAFFTTVFYKNGGINYSYLNGNSFLRPANILSNRLIGPSGREVTGERTLDYYISHEATHGLTVNKIGRLQYWSLPFGVREGYADYIGKGSIDFSQALHAFREGDPKMDFASSGLYSRYHLLTAYLLDIKKVSLDNLLYGAFDVQQLELELRTLNDK